MRILIVEDEKSIADGLQFNFEQEGYEVTVAGDGPTALEALRGGEVHSVVVLDLMLPGMSGYEICKEIRESDQTIPIMVLSARQTSQDKAHAFDCGADQYVTKPFDLNEVLSRVRNLIKLRSGTRSSVSDETPNSRFEFGNIVVDRDRFEVSVDGNSNTLTTMEMQLLSYFLENQNNVLSRAQIMRDVWEQSPEISSRSIDNFVMRLRRIIEPDPSNPQYILSVRGTGYRFATSGEAEPEA